MSHRLRLSRRAAVVAAASAGLALAVPATALASPAHQHHGGNLALTQVNLLSDLPGQGGALVDTQLVNPWGLAYTPTSPVWGSQQGTATAGAYSLAPGATTATNTGLNVTFPGAVLPQGGPTGQVANTTSGFVLKNGSPATFIFDTIDGKIEAWNAGDGSKGAVEDEATAPAGGGYTGLAIAGTRHGEELFAADFGTGGVDVFNSAFQPVKLAPWQFHDPRLPQGYRAFNAQELDGRIFVTYDTEVAPVGGAGPEGLGEGVGVVDEFSTDGALIARIATGGPLDAPWGLAIAPSSWGAFGGALLVGNFGDGKINIFAREGGHFASRATGQVIVKSTGKPFAEPGLWALLPGGSAATQGGTGALWFSAGITGPGSGPREHHGLVGVLRP